MKSIRDCNTVEEIEAHEREFLARMDRILKGICKNDASAVQGQLPDRCNNCGKFVSAPTWWKGDPPLLCVECLITLARKYWEQHGPCTDPELTKGEIIYL